jgi:nicotinate-nucleotide pyrophosphorylase (carboxylating)
MTPNLTEGGSDGELDVLRTRSPDDEVALDRAVLQRLADRALLEDRAQDDVTTNALVPDEQQGRAHIVAKAPGVIAGLEMARTVFASVDSALKWGIRIEDGTRVGLGDIVATIEGSIASILRGERVALNFLGHLSGVATATAAVVDAIRGTQCQVRDTRKTIPGLRSLQKYAIRIGGGVNHRSDLAGAVLIKDNHLAAVHARDLDIPVGVALAAKANPNLKIEVEVETIEQARQAIDAGAHEILLDNMPLKDMQQIVTLAAACEHRPALEASGGITLENAREVAETGVDYISIGALTHSAQALDLSLQVAEPE